MGQGTGMQGQGGCMGIRGSLGEGYRRELRPGGAGKRGYRVFEWWPGASSWGKRGSGMSEVGSGWEALT